MVFLNEYFSSGTWSGICETGLETMPLENDAWDQMLNLCYHPKSILDSGSTTTQIPVVCRVIPSWIESSFCQVASICLIDNLHLKSFLLPSQLRPFC